MNLNIILFLLLSSVTITLGYGRKLGIYGVVILSLYNMLFVFSTIVLNLYSLNLHHNFFYSNYMYWINTGLLKISFGFFFDSLTLLMIFVITSISLIVHFYSYEYMNNDPYIIRFFAFLSLFTFFMLILVTSENLILLFLGWEGVGVCSYLLISFWNTRILANKSAIKALLINKIGDVCLVVGVSILFLFFKTLTFSVIFVQYPYFLNFNITIFTLKFNLLNTIGFFILLGSMAKSAQIILHTWLPDAMEGPTPVSALIHAATMVTAGIFLIIRFSPGFEFMYNILCIMTLIGSLTTLLGATIGLFQNDIKKIIAYSTCSQLGYMMMSCGVSNYSGSLFHLINHAFFKALLFLSAGAIIHALLDEQDIRKMGNLVQLLPFIYISFLIGSLTLAGFPFLSGFYSKDIILESTLIHYNITSNIAFWFSLVSAFLTAFYSFRLIFLVFFHKNNSYKQIIKNIHDSKGYIFTSLFILIFASIIAGFFLRDILIGFGSNFLGASVFVLPWNSNIVDVEFIPYKIKLIPIFTSLFGVISVIYLYTSFFYFVIKYKIVFHSYYTFFNNKWYFNNIYNFFIAKFFFNLSYDFFFIVLDQGLCQPTNINNTISKLSIISGRFLTNNLHNYSIFLISNLFIFITLIVFIL